MNTKLIINLLFLAFSLNINSKTIPVSIDFSISTNMPGVEFSGHVGEKTQLNAEVTGNKITSLSLSIPAGDLKTGIDMRDSHMREKILKEKPVTFSSVKGCELKDNKCLILGELQIADHKKQVEIEITKAKNKLFFNYDLLLSQHGIEAPKFMGVEVKDKIEIKGSTNDQAL